MSAQIAGGDSWYRESGSAELTPAAGEVSDFTNAQQAEKAYRDMINMFPDSALIPRAKQKLRDVQEVLAERETQIGLYYESRENFNASIARLKTVVDTFPLYSKSDQALLAIGDAYAGEARN